MDRGSKQRLRARTLKSRMAYITFKDNDARSETSSAWFDTRERLDLDEHLSVHR